MNSEEPNPEGRPLAFKTDEELEIAIGDYFNECDNRIKEIHTKEGGAIAITHPEPYTMSGLALALGVDRRTLVNYAHRDEYFPTIKRAKQKVERDVERRLMETQNQSGAIFNLKNNFDWKDKTEQDITTGGEKLNPFGSLTEEELRKLAQK